MSKGSLFMGTARGKIGEVVMYRKDGEQISRVRVRKIGNPRSNAQMVQRAFMATSSRAYSKLQTICDHSFEGQNGIMRNMSRFTKLNIDAFRRKYENSPSTWRGNARYNMKNQQEALVNDYTISEGTLQPIMFLMNGTDISISGNGTLGENPTYQQVVDFLGVSKGDQITIVVADFNEPTSAEMGDVNYARIILEPNDGDMSKPFLLNNDVNLPNYKNQGKVWAGIGVNNGMLAVEFSKEKIAGSVILSRYENKVWRRSTQQLLVNDNVVDAPTLGEAVDSWATSIESSLYLNQAQS